MYSNNIGCALVAIGDINYCVVFVLQNSRSCYSKALISFKMCVCQCGSYSKKRREELIRVNKVI